METEDPIRKHKITSEEWSAAVDDVDKRTSISSLTNKLGRDAVDAAIVERVLHNRANPPKRRAKSGPRVETTVQTELPTHLSSQFEAVSTDMSFDDYYRMMRDTGAPSKHDNKRFTGMV